jgi:hypothetical protein
VFGVLFFEKRISCQYGGNPLKGTSQGAMDYPQEFSAQARARVEAERLKAGKDLEQYRNKTKARPRRQHTSGPYGTLWTQEQEDLHEYILSRSPSVWTRSV